MSKASSIPQTGILLLGPGGQRLNSLQSKLPSLTLDQHEAINKAKNYALDQSLKSLNQKQVLTSQEQVQKSLQRHQALVLMCRVYVGSISFEMRESTIKTAFAPFGAVKSINMSWDPITLKHKGFAFVEYELPEAAHLALIHMNGILLSGRQIKVGRPSNSPQAAPVIQQIQEECKTKKRIYVANVHPDLSETELGNLFDPFGTVISCKLALSTESDKLQHRGYGFIEFETDAAATEALTMDNFDLGGQRLYVCQATTPPENMSNYGTLESENYLVPMATSQNCEDDIHSPNSSTFMERAGDELEKSEISKENKRISTKEVQNNEQNISSLLVLKNMVTGNDDLDDSLQVDVYSECSKYGHVTLVLIHVDNKKQDLSNEPTKDDVDEVKIFVKYKDNESARRAREALNGRFFGGRKVSAEHYDQSLFRDYD